MGPVGLVLADDALAAELLFGLGGAEEVRGQFGAAHVVEDLLALLEPLASVDVLGGESAVKPGIAVVLEDGVIDGLHDAGLFGGVGQLDVVLFHFRPEKQAAFFFDLPVGHFLPPGLDGEIGLPRRDDFLGGIGVLDDEIAGVAGHHDDLDWALPALADFDHFGDINEMILGPLAAVETSRAGFFDDGLEVAVVRVAENLGKVAAGPEFAASGIGTADELERRRGCGHVGSPFLKSSLKSLTGAL